MSKKFTDPRTRRELGTVPSTVEGSTGAGELGGPTPTDMANAIGKAADATAAADAACILAAGTRQDADTAKRRACPNRHGPLATGARGGSPEPGTRREDT